MVFQRRSKTIGDDFRGWSGGNIKSTKLVTDRMSETQRPAVKRAESVEYESVEAAQGLSKGVLVGPDDGAPNFAMRRFTLAPGTTVPRHTNAVEHEQYVLEGEYVVGIDDEERTVSAGDSIFIPAETVHWYRNEGETTGAFLCVVPNGNDKIELLD